MTNTAGFTRTARLSFRTADTSTPNPFTLVPTIDVSRLPIETIVIRSGNNNQLRAKFEVRTDVSTNSSPAFVNVYNMSNSTAAKIRLTDFIFLEAGYSDTTQLIYSGRVSRLEHSTKQATRISEFEMIDNRTLSNVISVSRKGIAPTKEILEDIASKVGLGFGSTFRLISPNNIRTNYSFEGTVKDAFTSLISSQGYHWYESLGVIEIKPFDAAKTLTVPLSEQSGLVGVPTITDSGLSVKSLLNPSFRLDSRVDIQSIVAPEVSGIYKVITIKHKGDTWGGEWITQLELRR